MFLVAEKLISYYSLQMEEVRTGDTAVLIGAEGIPELAAPQIAADSGRISNELLCRMGARLPVIAV